MNKKNVSIITSLENIYFEVLVLNSMHVIPVISKKTPPKWFIRLQDPENIGVLEIADILQDILKWYGTYLPIESEVFANLTKQTSYLLNTLPELIENQDDDDTILDNESDTEMSCGVFIHGKQVLLPIGHHYFKQRGSQLFFERLLTN
jgi:hypothetical protein